MYGRWSKKTKSVIVLQLSKWYHDGEDVIIFVIELKLFSIGTINLHEIIQFMKTTYVDIMDISVKTSNFELKYEVHHIEKKTISNKYEWEITLKDKVYLET
jgi:hypothetical protein